MILFGHKTHEERWTFTTTKSPLDTHQIEAEPKCINHWPSEAGAVNSTEISHKIWYKNKCGGCGETIYPHSWVAVEK